MKFVKSQRKDDNLPTPVACDRWHLAMRKEGNYTLSHCSTTSDCIDLKLLVCNQSEYQTMKSDNFRVQSNHSNASSH